MDDKTVVQVSKGAATITSQDNQPQAKPKEKKTYSTPKLVVYGDIHILTGSVGMMGSTLDAGGMLKTS